VSATLNLHANCTHLESTSTATEKLNLTDSFPHEALNTAKC